MAARVTDGPVVFAGTARQPFHPRHYHLMAVGLHRAGIPTVTVSRPDRGAARTGEVPVELVGGDGGGRVGRFLSAPAVVRRVLRLRPSTVHVTTLDMLPWAVVLRILGRVPVLYDSNEDYPSDIALKEWLPRPVRTVLSRLVRWAEPACVGRLDGVTVADTGTLANFARVRDRTLVVRNFPWLESVRSAEAEEPAFDVTYHGSLPQLYLDPLLGTARMLAERGESVRWCLVARDYGPDEVEDLRKRIADLGQTDRFDLRFNQPYPAMARLLARTRVGFIPLPDRPKFHRNLPRKLFEYLAAGRPAVVSDLPPIRDAVGHTRSCLLVRPGDETEYADALGTLLGDPGRADEMGGRGRRYVEELLNAEREIRPYVDLVQRLRRG